MADIRLTLTNETTRQPRKWTYTVERAVGGLAYGLVAYDENATFTPPEGEDSLVAITDIAQSAAESVLSDYFTVARLDSNVIGLTEKTPFNEIPLTGKGAVTLTQVQERTSKRDVEVPESIGGGVVEPDSTREIQLDDDKLDAEMERAIEALNNRDDVSVKLERIPENPSSFSGKLQSALRSSGRQNELWVGPDGSDANPGTYSTPLATVQEAIDRLDEKVPVDEPKFVRVKSGRGVIEDNFVINVDRLYLIGETESGAANDNGSGEAAIVADDPSKPICTVTNMTKTGVENFQADGGLDYSFTPPDSYSYTGADINGREVRDDLNYQFSGQAWVANVEIHGVAFDDQSGTSNTPGAMSVVGVPRDGNDVLGIRGFYASSSTFNFPNSESVFLKNCEEARFGNAEFQGYVVLDSCSAWVLPDGKGANKTPYNAFQSGRVVVSGVQGGSSSEGGIFQPPTLKGMQNVKSDAPLYMLGESQAEPGVSDFRIVAGEANDLVHNSPNGVGSSFHRADVLCGTYRVRGEFTPSGPYHYVNRLDCQNLQCPGNATLNVLCLQAKFSVSITNGTGHTFNGGHVNGDVTIDTGAGVTLRGVTVTGDVIVDGDDTTVDLVGCHVEGALDVDSGGDSSNITVNVSGGSVANISDPNGFVTTETMAYG